MAIQVPRYDEQKIKEQGLPNVQVNDNAPLEAFGGGQGVEQVNKATQNVLGGVNDFLASYKKDADETKLREYESTLTKFKNTLLMDKDTGALTRKGKDSFGIGEQYNKAFQDYAEKLDVDAVNEVQRKGLSELKSKIGSSLNDSLEKHIFQESERYYVETAKSLIDTKTDDVALNYNDPKKVKENLKDIENTVNSFAQRQGYSSEQKQKLMNESKGKAHQNVIQMYLANDQDEAAEVYFEAYKDQMDDQTLKVMTKAVEEGTLAGKSQRKSTEILSKHGENMQAALDEARKIEDPKLQDQTVERVKKIFSENKAAERLENEDRLRQAANIIESTGSWEKVPKHLWAEFSPGERNTLKSMERNNGESNLESYYVLETIASNPATRQKFADMNLIKEFGSKLSKNDLKHFIKMQSDIRQGKGEAVEEMNGLFNKNQSVDNILLKAGIPKTKKQMYSDVRDKIDKQIREFQQATGKKATAEDIQKIAEKQVMQVAVPGWLFGKNKKLFFQVEPGEAVEPTSEDRDKIIESLKKANKPVTEENILKIFMYKVGNKRGQ